jgi:ribosome-associated translation inhibitor RaiA
MTGTVCRGTFDTPSGVTVSDFRDRLRVVPEFLPEEYDKVKDVLFGRLDRRLSRWDPAQVELEISMKERETAQQRVTLECWIAGVPKIVGTSRQLDMDQAVIEVRDDVWRQIDRHVTKQEGQRR